MAVVAQANDDADRFLRMVVGGRPLSGSVMQAAEAIVRSASQELIAVEDSAMARHATDRTPSTIEPEQRRTASEKLAYHRNLREALIKIGHSPDDFILIATQPLQSFPVLGAPDTTAQLIPRVREFCCGETSRHARRCCRNRGGLLRKRNA